MQKPCQGDRCGCEEPRHRHPGLDDAGIQPRVYEFRLVLKSKAAGGAWTLWEKLTVGRPEFGHPSVFTDHVDESKRVSFMTTQHDPAFFQIVRDATGNVAGKGGFVTFINSGRLLSIVLPHQPHLIGHTDDVNVLRDYGFFVDKLGDFGSLLFLRGLSSSHDSGGFGKSSTTLRTFVT